MNLKLETDSVAYGGDRAGTHRTRILVGACLRRGALAGEHRVEKRHG